MNKKLSFNLKYDEVYMEERDATKALVSHRRFINAWKAEGYPKNFHYRFDQKTGRGERIWDVASRKEALEIAEMKPATRELMIATRKAEYENRKKRQDIKRGIV